MTTSGVKDKKNGSGMDRITTTAQKVADTVAGVAGEAGARLPDAASSTRDALQEANRRVQAGSDETLKVASCIGGRLREWPAFRRRQSTADDRRPGPGRRHGRDARRAHGSRFLADEGRVRGLIAMGFAPNDRAQGAAS